MRRCALFVFCAFPLVLSPSAARAQSPAAPPASTLDPDEVAFARTATATLMNFASFARGKKVRTAEKRAYDLIITVYDPEHAAARQAAGYRKVKGEWQVPPPDERSQWVDKAKDKDRYDVVGKWSETARRLGELHRQRGLALKADGTGAAVATGDVHLRQAIQYDPFDAAAHNALGHEEENGYFGTRAELDFIKSMKEMETFALMLAKKQYEVTAIEEIPEELLKTGLEFHGARTKHFTLFVRGTQENADDVARWGERGLDFFERVAGERHGRRARRTMQSWAWLGLLWTPKELETFEQQNPERARPADRQTPNILWTKGTKTVEVLVAGTPAFMHDGLIARAFKYGLGSMNEQLVEGAMHGGTWFLKSTCMTRFGAPPDPNETRARPELPLPDGSNWWLREMRDQALAGTDLPMNNVPRVPFSRFSNDARLKSWSFMTWAMARYPKDWVSFVSKVPTGKVPLREDVDQIGEQVFKSPLADVEREWRTWASGRGVAAAATGYGPPLLPERPNDDEIEGLARLNALRALAKGLHLEQEQRTSLPPCDLDAEATQACKDHAVFLGKHEEHLKWPEAHEEDPAKEGFTPRGMRAGLRSVIIFGTQVDAADSVDAWIGTVYHRFPLLQYNIDRIGFAFAADAVEVIVLDMGSLEEPRSTERDQTFACVVWPPDKMTHVPRVFSFTEHPNPLADVGLDFDDQQHTGYPVSLQMSRLVAQSFKAGSLDLYVAKKRGGRFEPGEVVPCWVHTPDAPLLKRMEIRDVLFLIPKEHLAANTTYLAVARLNGIRAQPIEWTFTTGSQEHDLGAR